MKSIPHSAYPRPQLKRESYFCLNGKWDCEITSGEIPKDYKKTITVPFVPESENSGICRRILENDTMWYRLRFALPENFIKDRVILHFGAVDQKAEVFLNGTRLGRHEGGYLPFSFDITEYISEENTLTVKAEDALLHKYPWGKQKQKNGGMWYTPFSGIWQTVWIESVPKEYITSLKITPELDSVEIEVHSNSDKNAVISVDTQNGEISENTCCGKARITLPAPVNWTPEEPYLYNFTVTLGEDRVESYFALRTVDVAEIDGIWRIRLNKKPYFFHGLLDQGYWQKGICLPDETDGYEKDILFAKEMGFNTLRKHIRIEPLRFYYDCDRLGMIVFQDLVNNGEYSFIRDTALPTLGMKKISDKNINKDIETRKEFEKNAERTVRHLYNCPSVVYYTVFNEGWGQFEADKQYQNIKKLDDTRIIDSTSGWFKQKLSDVESEHVYFKAFKMRKTQRPLVLSEFGGYACSSDGKQYGYRFFKTLDEYRDAVEKLYEEQIVPAVKEGLCAAIYTQISDVEEEQNGLVSYDRKTVKVSKKTMLGISAKLKV